ncbi:hypothetical protein CONPUDRAFT_162678 [Coniophora puteana RWD-64-598 SS2]|uniref:Uncharacterized protein n=1 Tax=Coniophora puteana (strain RWD-64-598) TaxID=741705 RepID=A0A5M3N282_CONPW|nr:uncharacterized protein CONPUDRAFT_162678 [Coniophora puteana RWD-64-598 SS2]EIW85492.1 hypothetical protein CONPUDRAFT_162678 [Coniophora puteana RWD-64-598 SS2]
MRPSLFSTPTFVFTLVSLSTLTFADDSNGRITDTRPSSAIPIPTDSWRQTPTSPTQTLAKRSSPSLRSLAPIIGGAAGAGLVLIALLLLAVCYFRKHRHRRGRVFRVEPFKVEQLSLDAEMGTATPSTPGKWQLVSRVMDGGGGGSNTSNGGSSGGPSSYPSSSSPGFPSDVHCTFAPDTQTQPHRHPQSQTRPELVVRIEPRSHEHTPSPSPIPRSALSNPDSVQPGSIASDASLSDDEVRLVKSLYLCGVEPGVVAQVIRSMLDGKARSVTAHAHPHTQGQGHGHGQGHGQGHDVGVAIGSLEDVQHRDGPLRFATPCELEDAGVAVPGPGATAIARAGPDSQMHFLDLDPALDPNANVDAVWKAKEREAELQRMGSMTTQKSAAPSYTTNPQV